MRFLAPLLAAAAVAAGLGTFAAHAEPAKTIPLRDFFKNPDQAAHQLSPDGKWLGWVAPYERRLNVFVRPVAGGEPVRVTSETARSVAGFGFKGDRIVYAKDFGGDENFHVVSVDLKGGDLKDLTPGEKLKANVVDILYDDERHLLVSHNRRDPKVFDVYRIDVATGEEKLVAQNPGNIIGWTTDHDGKLRVAIASDGVERTLLYREREDEAFKPLVKTNYREQVAPLQFTADNRKLYVSSNRGRDKAAVFVFDPATAKEGEMLHEDPEVDVSGMTWSRKRKLPTTITWVRAKVERKFLDRETEARYRDVESKLPGYEISFTSTDRDESRFVVATSSDRTRGKRYFYDAKTKKLDLIADISPWLPEGELAEMKPVRYASRDGLAINGYLTLPKGVEAKNLPAVMVVHGGPWARDVWGFQPEVQFLANRGYAVLQVNFRGSTGYGRKFWESSFRQWGRTMQDDLTDGVQWLVKQGVADPKRVAIYGGSYGGYATLAGVAFTPDLYAAAVDYVGVSNLLTFLKAIPPYWRPLLDMFYDMVGNPDTDAEYLKERSPVFHADRIKTPLLIAQGARDPRVVKSESDQMVEAMRKRGVEVQYIVKDNEGHGFQNEENRFEFYEAMEAFLAKHLKG